MHFFDFSEALKQIKAGKFVTHPELGGVLFLMEGGDIPKSVISNETLREVIASVPGDKWYGFPAIRMFTDSKKIVTGWFPSGIDLFRNDWTLTTPPSE